MDWYKRYPAHYDRDTLHLSLAEHGAYSRLIDYYMLTEQPLPDNDRALAAILRCGLDEWLAVAPNVRAFFRASDGELVHKRCENELRAQTTRQSRITARNQANGAKGGRPRKTQKNPTETQEKPNGNPGATGAQNATSENPNISNEIKPTGFSAKTHGNPEREKEREIESSVLRTDADAAASPDQEPEPDEDEADLKARIFGPGLDWLARRSGKPKGRLRSLAGKWCSRYGDGATLEAMLEAQRCAPLDPVPYIERVLMGGGRSPPHRARGRLGMAEPATSEQLRASAPLDEEVDAIVATWGERCEGHA